MSLGIYDAFIFDQSYTMEELTKKIDILRKDVKKTIDIQLHKYVLEKFLYCYFLRENLSTDEILEIAKKETEYDRKMWLQDTAQGQWKSLYRNIVLYIRGKVRNQTRDNLLESLDYNLSSCFVFVCRRRKNTLCLQWKFKYYSNFGTAKVPK